MCKMGCMHPILVKCRLWQRAGSSRHIGAMAAMIRALLRPGQQGLVLQHCQAFSTLPAAAAPSTQPVPPLAPSAYFTSRPANPQEYSLVMKKAAEIGAASVTRANDKEVGLVAGVPLTTFTRKVRIYTPARAASQSGWARTIHNSSAAPGWKIAFDTVAKWENPLIGWTSSADPLENVARASLFFYNKEEAIAFCKKNGWEYAVDEPNVRRTSRHKRFNAYGDNFSVKRKGLPDLSHLPSNQK